MAGVGQTGDAGGAGDDDYMGDLSLFLPPDHPSNPSSSSLKKRSGSKAKSAPFEQSFPKLKRPKGVSWQEQRRIERERKQKEEDERTKAGLEAAIPDSNVGFKMLKLMGYNPGSALGKDGSGRAEPVGLEIRRSRAGIGVEEEAARREKESARKEREAAVQMRKREEELVAEFGSWRKTQWKSRKIVSDYHKAEAALAQLENRDFVEPPKEEEEGDEGKPQEEEEEEEVITEEDLLVILMKLRVEHRYCLYCGYQYESAEELATNCPGVGEEEH